MTDYVIQQDEIEIIDLTDHLNTFEIVLSQPSTAFFKDIATGYIVPETITVDQHIYKNGQLINQGYEISWFCNGIQIQNTADALILSPDLFVNNQCVIKVVVTDLETTATASAEKTFLIVEKQQQIILSITPNVVTISSNDTKQLTVSAYSNQTDVTFLAQQIRWYRNDIELQQFANQRTINVSWNDVHAQIKAVCVIQDKEYSQYQYIVPKDQQCSVFIESTNGVSFIDMAINTTLIQRAFYAGNDVTQQQTFQWYKNGSIVQGQTSSMYTVSGDTSTQLYSCDITYNGVNYNASITLTVVFSTYVLTVDVSPSSVIYTSQGTFSPQQITATPKLTAGNTTISNAVITITDEQGNVIQNVNSGSNANISLQSINMQNFAGIRLWYKYTATTTYNGVVYTYPFYITITNENYSWLADWTNATEITSQTIQTGKIFAGYKTAQGKLYGILVGNFNNLQIEGQTIYSGITQVQDNKKVFELVSDNTNPTSKVRFFVGDLNSSYINFDSSTGIVEVKGILRTVGGTTIEEQVQEIAVAAQEFYSLGYRLISKTVSIFQFSSTNTTYTLTVENQKNYPIEIGIILLFSSIVTGSNLTVSWNSYVPENIYVGTQLIKVRNLVAQTGLNELQVITSNSLLMSQVYLYQPEGLSQFSSGDDPSVAGVYISDTEFKISNGTNWVTYLNSDGAGYFAQGAISWSSDGQLTISGIADIQGGNVFNTVNIQGLLQLNTGSKTMKIGKQADGTYDGLYIDEYNYILPEKGFSFGSNQDNYIKINEEGNLEIKSKTFDISTGSALGLNIKNGILTFDSGTEKTSLIRDETNSLMSIDDQAIQWLPGDNLNYRLGNAYQAEYINNIYTNQSSYQSKVCTTITKKQNEPQMFVKLKFISDNDPSMSWCEVVILRQTATQLTVVCTSVTQNSNTYILKGIIKDQSENVLYSGILWLANQNTQSLDIVQIHFQASQVTEKEYGIQFLNDQPNTLFSVADIQRRNIMYLDKTGDLIVRKSVYANNLPVMLPSTQTVYFADDLVDVINGVVPVGYEYERRTDIEVVF